LYSLDYLFNAL